MVACLRRRLPKATEFFGNEIGGWLPQLKQKRGWNNFQPRRDISQFS
jgi:hypothetical protein